MIRRIVTCFLLLTMAIGMVFAGGDSEGDSEKLICYSFGPMTGGAAWGQFEVGFMQACEEVDWEGHFLAPTTQNNMSELVNLQETAITNGADVLLTLVIDNDAMADIFDDALEQGVTLFGVYTDDPHLKGYIGTNPQQLGMNVANALVEKMGDKPINVCTMQSTLSAAIQIAQVDAFEKRLFELRPDAVVARREECNSNAQTAQDKIAAIRLAVPECNALVSFDSYAGLGGSAYCEAEGLTQDEFCVIGIDDAPEILRAINDGWMTSTVAQMWFNMGYQAVYLAKGAREGADQPYANDSGTTIINRSGVQAWADKMGVEL